MTTASADEPDGRDAASVAAVAAAVLGLALTLGAFAIFSSRAALSVAAGATIAVANLVAMRAIIRRVLTPADTDDTPADTDDVPDATEKDDDTDHAAEGKRGGAAWGAFGVAKIVVLFGGFYLLLTRGMVDPMPLVVGYGVLPLGIAASTLFTSLAPRSKRPGRRPGAKNGRN